MSPEPILPRAVTGQTAIAAGRPFLPESSRGNVDGGGNSGLAERLLGRGGGQGRLCGVKVTYIEVLDIGHVWPFWRQSLANSASLLFK